MMIQVDTTKNYKELATAIVKRAIMDYEEGRKLRDKAIKGSSTWIQGQGQIDDVTRFFHSEWCYQLAKADGPKILEQIEKNYDEYGKCMPFNDDMEEKEMEEVET